MKNRRQGKFFVESGCFLVGIILLGGCGSSSSPPPAEKKVKPVFVGYRLPQRKNFKLILNFTASIVPILQADIRPKTSGWLTKVFVNTGEVVRKGKIVAEMDHVQQEAAVRQAEAELRSALDNAKSLESNLKKQEAILANDRQNMERAKNLLKEGFISQQQYDNARTGYLSSEAAREGVKAQLSAQRAQAERARAALMMAQANLEDTFLKAPFSGVVVMRNLDPGAFLSTAVTSGALPVASIADLRRVKVMVDVGDRDVPLIHPGQEAEISVDAYPGRAFYGRITRIPGALDPASRTFSVEVDIENPNKALTPGMFIKVSLVVGNHPNALVLPLDALVHEGEKNVVFVLEETPSGTNAKAVPVEIGKVQGSSVEILKGLKGDEHVVTEGKELLQPGRLIKAVRVGSKQDSLPESKED